MKKSTFLMVLLTTTLVASNIWWAYKILDAGVTSTYQKAALEENQQALLQTRAVIKVLAIPNATRAQIIEAAQAAWPSFEPFEKDGYLQVGRLGLKFDKTGHLIEVI